MKTYLAKTGEYTPKWHVIDASGKVLGRLSVQIANILRGRNRPTYTPMTDQGDFVVVVNADKVLLTGKKETGKDYMFFTGWVGNEKHRSAKAMRAHRPEFLIEHAVAGMMPPSRQASAQLTRLKVYAGPTHPHAAQNPEPLTF
jgi:large subunit ribosomal protein L13